MRSFYDSIFEKLFIKNSFGGLGRDNRKREGEGYGRVNRIELVWNFLLHCILFHSINFLLYEGEHTQRETYVLHDFCAEIDGNIEMERMLVDATQIPTAKRLRTLPAHPDNSLYLLISTEKTSRLTPKSRVLHVKSPQSQSCYERIFYEAALRLETASLVPRLPSITLQVSNGTESFFAGIADS